ncbi:uncharacterized protein LOC128217792 [Mya arenaria]|uniref:uncharacterized protein LOC128217792 n=1 Tax=Mya arenaria TaxID=6604 RepID=UPI0022E55C0F|nr:uncharacterized protein LOC128217792 [Mya arenaria]
MSEDDRRSRTDISLRQDNNMAGVSRAQMVSSDGPRYSGNRRPSMQTENIFVTETSQARLDAANARLELQPEMAHGPTRVEYGAVRSQPQRSDHYDRRHSNTRSSRHLHHDDMPNGSTRLSEMRHEPVHTRNPQVRSIYHENNDHSLDQTRRTRFRSVTSANSRVTDYDEKADCYVVPALPMPVAIFCCILNFIIPGFGSMCASLCVFCCARTDDMTCGDKFGSCCTMFGIGMLQLLLVACFLVGWIWSCIWGITFIGMSAEYYNRPRDDYPDDPQSESTNNPVYRRGAVARLPTPQVVVDQPYPGISYEEIDRQRRRRQAGTNRRARSRISLTPSNFIYPMRAPSNIAYNSPPPPYRENPTPHNSSAHAPVANGNAGSHHRHHRSDRSGSQLVPGEVIPEERMR